MGVGVGFHRHRHRPDLRHRQASRNKCVAGNDDLVAWPHAESHQRDTQRIETVADADRVAAFAELGELLLESLDFGPQYVPAGVNDALDAIETGRVARSVIVF